MCIIRKLETNGWRIRTDFVHTMANRVFVSNALKCKYDDGDSLLFIIVTRWQAAKKP